MRSTTVSELDQQGYRLIYATSLKGRTNHGEQIRVVDRAVILMAVPQTRAVQHAGHSQAKVSTKGMDGHRCTNIRGLMEREREME